MPYLQYLDVISNNIANVSTNGFKRQCAVFEDLLYQTIRQSGAQSLTAAFSRLLHRAPGPTSARTAVAAQFANAVSGGTVVSAMNTALISGVADSSLKILGKSLPTRITIGGEIGIAAGTDVQLNAGIPGRVTQYTAPVAAIAATGAVSSAHMEGIGELAVADAIFSVPAYCPENDVSLNMLALKYVHE